MLYSRGARIGVIEDYNQLASCIIDGKFSLPTAEEIQDRSKGDSLSKALIVGQTAWFVAQCLFRWIAGLAITEMELVTLAFAALNGIIYFLWWNKPLDVRYAVQVFRQAEGERSVVHLLNQSAKDSRKIMDQMSTNSQTHSRCSPRCPVPLRAEHALMTCKASAGWL